MCMNMGKADRIFRVVLGGAMIVYGVIAPNYVIAIIGAVPLLTAIVGICPLYIPFKFDTGCKTAKKEESEA